MAKVMLYTVTERAVDFTAKCQNEFLKKKKMSRYGLAEQKQY
jgi:hypothetical protein